MIRVPSFLGVALCFTDARSSEDVAPFPSGSADVRPPAASFAEALKAAEAAADVAARHGAETTQHEKQRKTTQDATLQMGGVDWADQVQDQIPWECIQYEWYLENGWWGAGPGTTQGCKDMMVTFKKQAETGYEAIQNALNDFESSFTPVSNDMVNAGLLVKQAADILDEKRTDVGKRLDENLKDTFSDLGFARENIQTDYAKKYKKGTGSVAKRIQEEPVTLKEVYDAEALQALQDFTRSRSFFDTDLDGERHSIFQEAYGLSAEIEQMLADAAASVSDFQTESNGAMDRMVSATSDTEKGISLLDGAQAAAVKDLLKTFGEGKKTFLKSGADMGMMTAKLGKEHRKTMKGIENKLVKAVKNTMKDMDKQYVKMEKRLDKGFKRSEKMLQKEINRFVRANKKHLKSGNKYLKTFGKLSRKNGNMLDDALYAADNLEEALTTWPATFRAKAVDADRDLRRDMRRGLKASAESLKRAEDEALAAREAFNSFSVGTKILPVWKNTRAELEKAFADLGPAEDESFSASQLRSMEFSSAMKGLAAKQKLNKRKFGRGLTLADDVRERTARRGALLRSWGLERQVRLAKELQRSLKALELARANAQRGVATALSSAYNPANLRRKTMRAAAEGREAERARDRAKARAAHSQSGAKPAARGGASNGGSQGPWKAPTGLIRAAMANIEGSENSFLQEHDTLTQGVRAQGMRGTSAALSAAARTGAPKSGLAPGVADNGVKADLIRGLEALTVRATEEAGAAAERAGSVADIDAYRGNMWLDETAAAFAALWQQLGLGAGSGQPSLLRYVAAELPLAVQAIDARAAAGIAEARNGARSLARELEDWNATVPADALHRADGARREATSAAESWEDGVKTRLEAAGAAVMEAMTAKDRARKRALAQAESDREDADTRVRSIAASDAQNQAALGRIGNTHEQILGAYAASPFSAQAVTEADAAVRSETASVLPVVDAVAQKGVDELGVSADKAQKGIGDRLEARVAESGRASARAAAEIEVGRKNVLDQISIAAEQHGASLDANIDDARAFPLAENTLDSSVQATAGTIVHKLEENLRTNGRAGDEVSWHLDQGRTRASMAEEDVKKDKTKAEELLKAREYGATDTVSGAQRSLHEKLEPLRASSSGLKANLRDEKASLKQVFADVRADLEEMREEFATISGNVQQAVSLVGQGNTKVEQGELAKLHQNKAEAQQLSEKSRSITERVGHDALQNADGVKEAVEAEVQNVSAAAAVAKLQVEETYEAAEANRTTVEGLLLGNLERLDDAVRNFEARTQRFSKLIGTVQNATDEQLAAVAEQERDESHAMKQNGKFLLSMLRLHSVEALYLRMAVVVCLHHLADIAPQLAGVLRSKHHEFVSRMKSVMGGDAMQALKAIADADALASDSAVLAPAAAEWLRGFETSALEGRAAVEEHLIEKGDAHRAITARVAAAAATAARAKAAAEKAVRAHLLNGISRASGGLNASKFEGMFDAALNDAKKRRELRQKATANDIEALMKSFGDLTTAAAERNEATAQKLQSMDAGRATAAANLGYVDKLIHKAQEHEVQRVEAEQDSFRERSRAFSKGLLMEGIAVKKLSVHELVDLAVKLESHHSELVSRHERTSQALQKVLGDISKRV